MACRLFGAKPLSEPLLEYCLLDPWEQTSVKFESKYKFTHFLKFIWKSRRWNVGHFVQGGGGGVKSNVKLNSSNENVTW